MKERAILRRFNCAMVLCILLGLSRSTAAFAPPDYKDINNTKGIPDIHQGDGTYCDAAALSDALWYFNQTHNGIVDTAANGWYDRSRELFEGVRKRVYGDTGFKTAGFLGSLQYLYTKVKNDFKAPEKETGAFETQWAFEHKSWKSTVDLENLAKATLSSANAVAIPRIYLHKQGSAADDFKVPLASGNDGIWAHSFAYAGRDYAAQTPAVTTHGIFSHGWSPTHENDANPVNKDYYNRYSISVDATSKEWRITDNAFTGSAGGLGDNPNINYAHVFQMPTLRDNKKYSYGYKIINPGTPQFAGESQMVIEHTLGNGEDVPLKEFAFELPLINSASQGWLSSLSLSGLPSGWSWEYWNPNDTPYMTPLVAMDEGGLLEREYRGIRVFTDTNPLLPQSFLDFQMSIDGSAVDYYGGPGLGFAVSNQDLDYNVESLGVAIPEPASLLCLIVGAALWRRRGVGRKRG